MQTKLVRLQIDAYNALNELQQQFSKKNSGLKISKSEAVVLAQKYVDNEERRRRND